VHRVLVGKGEGEKYWDRVVCTIAAVCRVLAAKPKVQIIVGEWANGALIALAMVGGSVRHERTFSFVNMLTGNQRNSLTAHLELCVRFWEQQMFNLTTLPVSDSIKLM
jgi:hypothetical protein